METAQRQNQYNALNPSYICRSNPIKLIVTSGLRRLSVWQQHSNGLALNEMTTTTTDDSSRFAKTVIHYHCALKRMVVWGCKHDGDIALWSIQYVPLFPAAVQSHTCMGVPRSIPDSKVSKHTHAHGSCMHMHATSSNVPIHHYSWSIELICPG